MDSLSQIVLGAAVGEAVLGKKIGNKAMVWGGIAGTIPDLDIIASPFMTELESLVFHRGITHSFLFTIVGAFGFGALIHWFYKRKKNRTEDTTRWDWIKLFFWCFITHVLLDCFTTYGTQVFSPFTDYRAAVGSVAVADILYTLPFITCLIVASRKTKGSKSRSFWNWLGIGWSCFYLMLTMINRQQVIKHYENTLVEQNIAYQDIIIVPVILSNFLWTATVELEDEFLIGRYSIFDTSPIRFTRLKKNYDLLAKDIPNDHTLKTLSWFSEGFFNVVRRQDGKLQLNDLRFGMVVDEPENESAYIFRFPVAQDAAGNYELVKTGKGPTMDKRKSMIGDLWERVKGQ